MLLSALQVHGRYEEIHQHTIGHNFPWDGKVSAELTDRSYNRFAENWENKKYTSHVLQFICSHLRFLTKMNLPGRSAATLPALGRVGPGIMRTVFLICAMNG